MEKPELYKLAIEQFREHPRIYWTRSKFFVALQSGLFAFAAFQLKNEATITLIDLVLSCMGLVISLVWLRITIVSRGLLSIWREIVLELEQEVFDGITADANLPQNKQGIFQRSTKKGEGQRFSITAVMVGLAFVFVISWGFLVAFVWWNLAQGQVP